MAIHLWINIILSYPMQAKERKKKMSIAPLDTPLVVGGPPHEDGANIPRSATTPTRPLLPAESSTDDGQVSRSTSLAGAGEQSRDGVESSGGLF